MQSANVRASGSTRRGAVSSSRDAVIVGGDLEPSRSRADASPGALRKISSGQRGSLVHSSEHKRISSSRNTSSNIKNFESTLKGIESLHFNNEERVQYLWSDPPNLSL